MFRLSGPADALWCYSVAFGVVVDLEVVEGKRRLFDSVIWAVSRRLRIVANRSLGAIPNCMATLYRLIPSGLFAIVNRTASAKTLD